MIEFKKAQMCDCELLFNWASDSEVRNNSFNKNYINYEDHLLWFETMMQSPDVYTFICYFACNPIGQIRIDCESNAGLINYSIDEDYRGRGFGTLILKNIGNIIKENKIKIDQVIGRVKYDNISSQKVFIKAGFNQIKKNDYIEYIKEV